MDKINDITEFLENASLILGFAHGSIAMILEKPDAELRDQLIVLKHELDKRVERLYYNHDKHVQ